MAGETFAELAREWSFPLGPAVSIGLTAVLYGRGWWIARRTRPAELPPWRACCFYAGLAALWLALASPIDALDDYLLAAHMIQHFMLMSVIPPLLLLGAPAVPLLRGLPGVLIRVVIGPLLRLRWFRGLEEFILHPMTAWLAMNVAYLGWHLPAAFELTLRSEDWHNFEHLCFLLTSLLFWWEVLLPWPARRRWPQWTVIPYLLSADVVNTILSAVLTFSGRVLYPSYGAAERITRLTPLQDQIAAGSEMWVLNSMVFLIPAIGLTVRMLSPSRGKFTERLQGVLPDCESSGVLSASKTEGRSQRVQLKL